MKTENANCISVAKAAQMLGICKTSLYANIRDGTIPYIRIGRRIVIPEGALLNWIQAQTESKVTACSR